MEPSCSSPVAQNIKGSLTLDFEADSSGRTWIRDCYRTGLFHIGKPYWDGEQLVVQVVNPTAGIFENDKLDSRVSVSKGCRVCLLSPSSTQVYTMPSGGFSTSEQVIQVEAGASLAFLPKWLVLHRGSRFKQVTRIDLAESSSLLYVDLLSAGRASYGEFLEYDQFSSTTTVRVNGKLILKERLVCGRNLNRWIWGAEDTPFAYLANLYIAFPSAAEVCEGVLPTIPDYRDRLCSMGMTPLSPDFVSVRIVSASASDIQETLKQVCERLKAHVPVSSVYQRIS